jgi:hypothetical protein
MWHTTHREIQYICGTQHTVTYSLYVAHSTPWHTVYMWHNTPWHKSICVTQHTVTVYMWHTTHRDSLYVAHITPWQSICGTQHTVAYSLYVAHSTPWHIVYMWHTTHSDIVYMWHTTHRDTQSICGTQRTATHLYQKTAIFWINFISASLRWRTFFRHSKPSVFKSSEVLTPWRLVNIHCM